MAVAFMLAHPYGNPRVMSSFNFNSFEDGPPSDANGNIISASIAADGSCGNGWICEHRWRQIYNMVGFRNFAGDANLVSWWDNGANQIAFCRGNRGFVAINAENADLKRTLHVCLPAGTYCDIISGELVNGRCTGKSINVDTDGKAYVEILNNELDGVLAVRGDVSSY
jgi:alpha-amylase